MCHNLGSTTSPTLVSESSTAEDPVTQTVVIVRQPGDPGPSLHRRVDMVEHATVPVERQRCSSPSSRHDDQLRCLTDRVGSCLQQSLHRGTLVSRGEEASHQSLRASSGILRSAVLRKGEEHTRSSTDGQQHCLLLCQQDGGTRSTSLMGQARQLWQWCLQRGITLLACRVPPRCGQSDSRQRVSVLGKMEATRGNLSGCVPGTRLRLGGPLCITPEPPTGSVHETHLLLQPTHFRSIG